MAIYLWSSIVSKTSVVMAVQNTTNMSAKNNKSIILFDITIASLSRLKQSASGVMKQL